MTLAKGLWHIWNYHFSINRRNLTAVHLLNVDDS